LDVKDLAFFVGNILSFISEHLPPS
jgi:hypothetical protein